MGQVDGDVGPGTGHGPGTGPAHPGGVVALQSPDTGVALFEIVGGLRLPSWVNSRAWA